MKKIHESHNLFTSYRFTAIMACVNICIIAAMLIFMTRTDNQSANISQDTSAIAQMNIQNQVLQEQIAQAQSISSVDQKAQELGMAPVTSIIYLTNGNIVADNMH